MDRKEFENWYREKTSKSYKGCKNWLEYKAKYFISKTNIDYKNAEEVVSLTIEHILENLEEIKIETVDSYAFFTMKKCLYNKLIYPKRNECCEGDWSTYDIECEEYTGNEEDFIEKRIKILQSRVKGKEEKLALSNLLKGEDIKSLGFYGVKSAKFSRKLKGLPPLKKINKSRDKGLKKGRPMEYEGIARIKLGKIEKVYESVKAVEIDDFTPELVRRCLKGDLKHHKGCYWKLVKDLKAEENGAI